MGVASPKSETLMSQPSSEKQSPKTRRLCGLMSRCTQPASSIFLIARSISIKIRNFTSNGTSLFSSNTLVRSPSAASMNRNMCGLPNGWSNGELSSGASACLTSSNLTMSPPPKVLMAPSSWRTRSRSSIGTALIATSPPASGMWARKTSPLVPLPARRTFRKPDTRPPRSFSTVGGHNDEDLDDAQCARLGRMMRNRSRMPRRLAAVSASA
mmetsp:Transcript_46723/g.134584  ORF Transcript_46723/g.134584 Transcript_46723/m.134584 type:complete len:212 (+) Transcript_46723:634-1269(+)